MSREKNSAWKASGAQAWSRSGIISWKLAKFIPPAPGLRDDGLHKVAEPWVREFLAVWRKLGGIADFFKKGMPAKTRERAEPGCPEGVAAYPSFPIAPALRWNRNSVLDRLPLSAGLPGDAADDGALDPGSAPVRCGACANATERRKKATSAALTTGGAGKDSGKHNADSENRPAANGETRPGSASDAKVPRKSGAGRGAGSVAENPRPAGGPSERALR
jgi:hypothetical protein